MANHLYQGDLPDGLDLGPVVAIDCETMGLHPHRDRLCVVQLSGGDGNAHLVQVAKGQTEAPNLCRLLEDPNVLKLFHFGRFDIAAMYNVTPKIEAIARYDEYNRMQNISPKERIFKNTTIGFSYKFEGVNRIDFNYTFAKANAPYNNTAESILNNAGDIARIQLTWVYK